MVEYIKKVWTTRAFDQKNQRKQARVFIICTKQQITILIVDMNRWLVLDSSKCPNDQVPKQLLAPAAKDGAAALLRASTGPSKSLTRLGIQLVQLARCQTL